MVDVRERKACGCCGREKGGRKGGGKEEGRSIYHDFMCRVMKLVVYVSLCSVDLLFSFSGF